MASGKQKIGIFMAYGPDIKQAGKIENVSILDLAPTILHLMGLEISSDMDGRVLKEIFREGSDPDRRAMIFQKVRLEERERLKTKIRVLKIQGRT